MFQQLRKIASTLRVPTRRERVEIYLGQATDRYDLEFRMQQVSRGEVF
ncbi:DUF3563 family protein [Roseibium sp. RKSG952]|nr:DUF3563 family protein [Roseibium sp. RKSG952]MTH96005.1 DUF3563 domain-containing protein [Roseibium sp. RKSG952]